MIDLLESRKVMIRKPAFCWGCGRKFQKGKQLRLVTSVDNGIFSHTKWCNVCDEYWTKYMDNYDEIGFGELLDADKEGWLELQAQQDVQH